MKHVSRVGLGAVLVLMLVACPTPPVVSPSNSPNLGLNPTITGTVANYSDGAGNVEIRQAPFFGNAGTIASNGTFSITLPSSGVPLFNLSFTCISGTGSVSVTPSTTKTTSVSAHSPQGFAISQSDVAKSTLGEVFFLRYRMFVDKDVVLNGSCTILTNTFSGTKNLVSYTNLSLKAGWNEITEKNTVNSTGGFDQEYALGISSSQPWKGNFTSGVF